PEDLLLDMRLPNDSERARTEVAQRIMGPPPAGSGRVEVLGLLIDETQRVPNSPPPPELPKFFGNSIGRVLRIIETATGTWDDAAVHHYKHEICRLPAQGYGVLEFGMDADRLDPLLQAARTAV